MKSNLEHIFHMHLTQLSRAHGALLRDTVLINSAHSKCFPIKHSAVLVHWVANAIFKLMLTHYLEIKHYCHIIFSLLTKSALTKSASESEVAEFDQKRSIIFSHLSKNFDFKNFVFLSIIYYYRLLNRKENCHHDHIPFDVKGNGNIVFSATATSAIVLVWCFFFFFRCSN